MPKSKRNKQIELSKTKKHGLEGKKKLFEEVRSCVETYTHLFIFSVNDMRNSKIKSVREQWKHSRFFIGKNKVMAKALGMNPEDEFRMNIHKIGRRLKGERGLLFSNQSIEEVLKWFSSYSEGDFARSGNRATETVILQEGPLSQFPHNLEPYLRQLGLPTTLKKGIIHLVKDHTVCNVGDVLTPETAKIVKLLGYEMAEFYIKIECVWSQDGSFSDFTTGEESKENLHNSNSLTVSKQASDEFTSMDIDEVEVTEPSDEMIETIIMKNRKSLLENKQKQLEKEASSNESSDDEEMADFVELKTVGKRTSLDKSNDFSPKKVENGVSEIINILPTMGNDCNETVDISEALLKKSNDLSPEKIKKDASEMENILPTTENDACEMVETSENMCDKTNNNDEQDDQNSEFVERTTLATIDVESKVETSESVEDNLIEGSDNKNNIQKEMLELVEATKSIVKAEDVDKAEKISEANENTKADTYEDESDEDEEIPELVEGSTTNNTNEDKSIDEKKVDSNEVVNNTHTKEEVKESIPANSHKRLSLDKSALQSPVMLEKRPKYSPKMTRSAMKAKKTVSNAVANKVNDQSKSSSDEVNEEKLPRGRAHKRHSSGQSPAERKLRNRSIKIVKKKK